jgi:hypothetical protein
MDASEAVSDNLKKNVKQKIINKAIDLHFSKFLPS